MSAVAEISSYIDYSYYGLGIGSELLEYVITDCNRTGKETLFVILLDINPRNIEILKFHFKKWDISMRLFNYKGKHMGS